MGALFLVGCATPVAPTPKATTAGSPIAGSVEPTLAPMTASAVPSAVATRASPSSSSAGVPVTTPLPAHVFAPYLEMYSGDRVLTLAQDSGARHFTLAFLETTGTASCEIGWGGVGGFSDQGSMQLIDDANALRAMGGDIVPSFGGYSADNQGREIGDSCADPAAIADAYESVVATFGVSRLDMDVEDESLNKADGIDRRNKGLRILQDRLAASGRTVEVEYTLPTSPHGLDADGLAVLRNALDNGTRVDIVNIMVFDFYDGTTTDMGAAAISAATALHAQLATLYPARADPALWAMIGLTLMPGIDDYPNKTEVTTLKHAQQVLAFARQHGLASLSMWAAERDHGTCPGEAGNDGCSGIKQDDWAFTRLLGGFTGP